ncbi:hypothetical protein TrCOL_g5838 [Triparma columacea]|uniref:Uncharacterized protein n=1 Tax=Triparma columacea TaxID=722753 RepID=A0A9W7LFM4_9STRA|nr:hypothetical protein TrCOL_g5838 [Triparma columacea]
MSSSSNRILLSSHDLNHLLSSAPSVYSCLSNLRTQSLQSGVETLRVLLSAGEVRSLDSSISRMARDGALNEGFFHVLEANIDEALEEEGKLGGEVEGGGQVTTRSQVLTHINTRCKEELEKVVSQSSPSSAFLQRVLRSSSPSIRSNLIRDFLAPQTLGVSSLDDGGGNVLPPKLTSRETVSGIKELVVSIRSLANAASPEAVESLVEEVRGVAIDCRKVLEECYGRGEEVEIMEKGLMDVF